MEKLHTAREIAKITGNSIRTIYDRRWRRRWGMMGIKIGRLLRFRESDLERFLKEHEEKEIGGGTDV